LIAEIDRLEAVVRKPSQIANMTGRHSVTGPPAKRRHHQDGATDLHKWG
jgi:hypothetical protein